MSKVNIKSKLLNKTNNDVYNIITKGIKDNNIIKFYDNEVLNLLIINPNNIRLERKNSEYSIIMEFSEGYTKGIYKLKDLNLDFKIKTNYIKKEDNYIEIDYIIYMDDEIEYNYIIDCRC